MQRPDGMIGPGQGGDGGAGGSGGGASAGASGLYSLKGVVLLVLAYSVAHVGARLLASGNLGENDALSLLNIQTLARGWELGQPPLHDWLIAALEPLTGPTVVPFQIVRYGSLIVAAAFLFLIARRATGSNLWALLSVESLALIYQVSWRFHEGFTHPMVAMAAVAATFWALLRAADYGRGRDFALLGAIVGVGLLSDFWYWLALAVIAVASAFDPYLRAGLGRARLALAIAVALMVASPFLSWLVETEAHRQAIAAGITARLFSSPWPLMAQGLSDAVVIPILYLSPLIFILPALFPRIASLATLRPTPMLGRADPDFERLFLRITAFACAALATGALIFGFARYAEHSVMPLFLLTGVYLMMLARKACRGEHEIRRLVFVAIALALVAFAGRLANMYGLQPFCKLCRWGVPYEAVANHVRGQGAAAGVIVTVEQELAGNLRRHLPQARFINLPIPGMAVVPEPWPEPIVIVWREGKRGGDPKLAAGFLNLAPSQWDHAATVDGAWQHLWRPDGHVVSRWRVLVLP